MYGRVFNVRLRIEKCLYCEADSLHVMLNTSTTTVHDQRPFQPPTVSLARTDRHQTVGRGCPGAHDLFYCGDRGPGFDSRREHIF
jgi:hypothetical protein